MYHNKCIVCHSTLIESLTIDHLFSKTPCVCQKCTDTVIQHTDVKRCPNCQKQLLEDETECLDCLFINTHFGFTNKVDFVTDYCEEVSTFIHQYKSNGDIVLAHAFAAWIFQRYNKQYFKQYDYIIPMPISRERLKSRGFNHITEILNQMSIKYDDILTTDYREKQMILNKRERIHQTNPFKLTHPIKDSARILLVDDIYTTGLTVSHARSVFLSYKHCEINVLAFARA